MEVYSCFLCNKVYKKLGSLSCHLYIHVLQGDVAPKQPEAVSPDQNDDEEVGHVIARNVDDEVDIVIAGNVSDTGNINGSNDSKGSIESASVKWERRQKSNKGKENT